MLRTAWRRKEEAITTSKLAEWEEDEKAETGTVSRKQNGSRNDGRLCGAWRAFLYIFICISYLTACVYPTIQPIDSPMVYNVLLCTVNCEKKKKKKKKTAIEEEKTIFSKKISPQRHVKLRSSINR